MKKIGTVLVLSINVLLSGMEVVKEEPILWHDPRLQAVVKNELILKNLFSDEECRFFTAEAPVLEVGSYTRVNCFGEDTPSNSIFCGHHGMNDKTGRTDFPYSGVVNKVVFTPYVPNENESGICADEILWRTKGWWKKRFPHLTPVTGYAFSSNGHRNYMGVSCYDKGSTPITIFDISVSEKVQNYLNVPKKHLSEVFLPKWIVAAIKDKKKKRGILEKWCKMKSSRANASLTFKVSRDCPIDVGNPPKDPKERATWERKLIKYVLHDNQQKNYWWRFTKLPAEIKAIAWDYIVLKKQQGK